MSLIFDLELQTRLSYGSHVIVNLAQIHSAVPEIFRTQTKLEAKDALPNINRTQAAERPKMPFLSLVTLTFDY